MVDKGDLRKRFTPGREASPPPDTGADYARLASELAENVGKTVKVATELGLIVAETVGLKMMEFIAPAKPAAGAPRAKGTAASAFASAKEKLPEVSGQTASKLTDLVVSSGFAVLRAVQQTVQSTRRQG